MNLTQGSDTNLYGLAQVGGSSGGGTIFRFTPVTNAFLKIHDFDGALNGKAPHGSLVQAVDNYLYGMTGSGGLNSVGIAFKIQLNGAGFSKVLDFDGASKGSYPNGTLMQASDLNLYGFTEFGGANDSGVIFKMHTDGTNFAKIVDFDGTNKGANPVWGPLLEGAPGIFYGVASSGGISLAGTIFSVKSDGTFTKLLDCIVGPGHPYAGLTQANNGDFFGSVTQGGNSGFLFRIKKDGSNYTPIVNFDRATIGSTAYGAPIQASNGDLYGMTSDGGSNGKGVIYRVRTDGTNYVKLLDFDGNNGNNPIGNLLQVANGDLYGLTKYGGLNNLGVIFRIKTDGSGFTKLLDFDGIAKGSYPWARI